MTNFAVSGVLLRNSPNFLREAGLLYLEDGFERMTSLFGARKGMALTALFKSFSVIVRASRWAVFIPAVVTSLKSDSKSLIMGMMSTIRRAPRLASVVTYF